MPAEGDDIMINSVKFILKERKLKQSDLKKNESVRKQYISRWINRERKFDYSHLKHWKETLGVEEKYIVGDDGYCKLLNEVEFQELKDILFVEKFNNIPDKFKESEQIDKMIRRRALNKRISKVNKAVNKDINSTIYHYNNSDDIESVALDSANRNVNFYETVICLHKSKLLSEDEWYLILKALTKVDETMISTAKEEAIFINSIRDAIKKYRKYIETEEQKRMNERIELAKECMELFEYD